MPRAYACRPSPPISQRELMAKHIGCVRFVYNNALAAKIAAYQTSGKSVSRFELDKQLTSWKREEETAWLREVNSQSLQAVIRQVESAFTRFFRDKKGCPRFKGKHDHRCLFECPAGVKVDFATGTMPLPKLEAVRAECSRTFEGQVKTVTVRQSATGKYYAYYALALVETHQPVAASASVQEETAVGIEVGLKDFATLSTGEKVANPWFLCKSLKRLQRLGRQHSKKRSHKPGEVQLATGSAAGEGALSVPTSCNIGIHPYLSAKTKR